MFLSRFLGKHGAHSRTEKEDLDHEIALAQAGNAEIRDSLLRKYTPFISRVTSKVCKRFIDPSSDDEFSVALEAFDEAILKYTTDRGSSFLSFADLVIRRRVIDFIRKEARHTGQLSLERREDGEEESDQSALEAQVAMKQFQLDYEADLRREEIQHYKEKLQAFDIDLMELPEVSPKHSDARQNAISIAKTLVSNKELRASFLQKQKLPMKELMRDVDVSRKTVERNRTYIIAVSLLLLEDYQYLHQYLQLEKEGMTN